MNKSILYISCLLLLVTAACKKAYQPFVLSQPNQYLVVEGVINTAAGKSTIIKLSKSRNINDTVSFEPVTSALVKIEAETGPVAVLSSVGEGRYESPALVLNPSGKYRLTIDTEGNNYQSDYVLAKNNSEIDSVTWERPGDVNLYLYTHDPTNNTRYYRWEYEETWEYNSLYNGIWGLDANRRIILLDSTNQTYTCWKTVKSSDILIKSTIQLSEDVVSRLPLSSIRQNSEGLYNRYSLLVRQYSLTPEAFQFWEILKKNTQSLGGIFDQQPSQLKSNFRCTNNPAQPVIGYLSVCPVREQRIFIKHSQVPGWPAYPPNPNCEVTFIDRNPVDMYIFSPPPPAYPYYFITGGGIAVTNVVCVDCRFRGGVSKTSVLVTEGPSTTNEKSFANK